MTDTTVENLLDQFAQGDRRALSQILSLVQRGEAPPRPQGSGKGAVAKRSLAVGITGSGGAGKSTLIGALVRHLRSAGKSVAVLANDPQSPLTGGALLGDRIRMGDQGDDAGVFIRSISTRGAPGGIAATTGEACRWLAAFGFDVVLVETVGVGQDQVAIRAVVDRLVLLVTPGSGDEVQWEKAGLIEVADVIAINKSDLPGADRLRADLTAALSLSPAGNQVPIVHVVATTGRGVAELWDVVTKDA
ncbi:MAG: GTP-binding protein [Pirellulales bacterium]